MSWLSEISQHNLKTTWGIVGGMGPLASAEFIKTVYELSLHGNEQLTPTLILNSDPSFPDRTDYLINQQERILLDKLSSAIDILIQGGAKRIVICCITIHALINRLPLSQRQAIISLVDLILVQVIANQYRHLLLCTNGARHSQIFESHPHWGRAKDFIVMPDKQDQDQIHSIIYELKKNCIEPRHMQFLIQLARKYRVDGLIAGCTEFHVLMKTIKHQREDIPFKCLDPLCIVAQEIAECNQFLPAGNRHICRL